MLFNCDILDSSHLDLAQRPEGRGGERHFCCQKRSSHSALLSPERRADCTAVAGSAQETLGGCVEVVHPETN